MTQTKQFTWNDKQQQVIESLADTNKIFVEGGVRAGKSWLICWLIDYICQRTPGMIALVLRKSYESIKTDTHIILKHNPGYLTPDKGSWVDGSRQFNYNNGSIIYFRHAEGAEHLLGFTAGIIFFEQVELIKEEDFDLIKNTRLSQWGGEGLLTVDYLTKYAQHIKIGQLLYPRNYLFMTANPHAGWLKGRYIDKQSGEFKRFHVSTFDNMKNLPEQYVADMANATDEFKRIYYDGSWEFNSGLIYAEFDDNNLVSNQWEIVNDFYPSKLRTYVGIDPGYSRSKFAVLMSAIMPDGRIYIFDEVVHNGKAEQEWQKIGIPEIINEMKTKYEKYKFVPNISLIDYAANAKIGGMESISGQFIRFGIPVSNSIKTDELASIFRIKQLLKEKKIIINDRCRQLIREMKLYRWHEKKLNSPVDEDNDCCDALRYIINATPHALLNEGFTPQQIDEMHHREWSQANIQKQWLKSWYGKENSDTKDITRSNDNPLDWGL